VLNDLIQARIVKARSGSGLNHFSFALAAIPLLYVYLVHQAGLVVFLRVLVALRLAQVEIVEDRSFVHILDGTFTAVLAICDLLSARLECKLSGLLDQGPSVRESLQLFRSLSVALNEALQDDVLQIKFLQVDHPLSDTLAKLTYAVIVIGRLILRSRVIRIVTVSLDQFFNPSVIEDLGLMLGGDMIPPGVLGTFIGAIAHSVLLERSVVLVVSRVDFLNHSCGMEDAPGVVDATAIVVNCPELSLAQPSIIAVSPILAF